jgi:hypothetical protein
MNQNQTESKPTDAEQESGKGLDGMPCCAFCYSPDVGKAEFEDFIACKVEEGRHTENKNAPVFHLLQYLRDAGFDFYY